MDVKVELYDKTSKNRESRLLEVGKCSPARYIVHRHVRGFNIFKFFNNAFSIA